MTTVLLIEDAHELAQVIVHELREAGYEVLHAADGVSGLQLHATHSPDLVILDWMLPRLDGLQVLRRIRQVAPTPVLMLTARSDEVDRVLGLEVGADDYLTKPFSMRELIARVHALLRRLEHVREVLNADRQGDGSPITCGLLYLDPLAYQATLDSKPLELTRTEFDLLYLLLRYPGRAFSRSYLLDTVWGEHYIAGDRSVDNAILRLRKKIGPLGESIETVWGIGYRFQPESRDEGQP